MFYCEQCSKRTPHIKGKLDTLSGGLYKPKKEMYMINMQLNGETVGHMPRDLPPESWFCIKRGGSISCTITGHRKFGVGLEVPCDYIYTGSKTTLEKIIGQN